VADRVTELTSAATPVRAAGLEDGAVRVEFADGRAIVLNGLALRDGCPCAACRHPVSGQRLFESGQVLRGLRATDASATADGALTLEWSDGHRGVFPAGWFAPTEPRRIMRWDASLAEALAEHEWAAVVDEPEARAAWLRDELHLNDSAAYGQVRLGRGTTWEPVYEMPAFDLNADVYSPVRLAAFAEQVQDFADAIRDHRSPAVAPADARAAIELVAAARLSDQTGAAVRLPLDTTLHRSA